MEHKEEWIKPKMTVSTIGMEKHLELGSRLEQALGGLRQNNFGNMEEQGNITHPENE